MPNVKKSARQPDLEADGDPDLEALLQHIGSRIRELREYVDTRYAGDFFGGDA